MISGNVRSVNIIIHTAPFVLPGHKYAPKAVGTHIDGKLPSWHLSQGDTTRIQLQIPIRINMLKKNIAFFIKTIIHPGNECSPIPIRNGYRVLLTPRKVCYHRSAFSPQECTCLTHLMGKNIAHTKAGIRPNEDGLACMARCYCSEPFNVYALTDGSTSG